MNNNRITLHAEIEDREGPSLDPQRHDASSARALARQLCNVLTSSMATEPSHSPETMAVAVQTALETLISECERNGLSGAGMRVALAKSLLENGKAYVRLEIDGEAFLGTANDMDASIH